MGKLKKKEKSRFQRLVFWSLIFTVFFAGIMCCCVHETSHAQETMPSCHEMDSPQQTDECDCRQTSAILIKSISLNASFDFILALSFDQYTDYGFYSKLMALNYHAPPKIYNSDPLYIKHSVLRI